MELNDLVTFKGNKVTIQGNHLKKGDKAENFKAVKEDLSEFNLNDIKDKIIVISSFPSIDTGVCAIQTTKFNQELSKYNDVVLINISVDLPFAQSRFCKENSINNSITVSDYKDLDFGLKYGFVIKEFRLLSRGVVVIDKNKTINYIEYVKEVSSHIDYNKVLETIDELTK